MTICVARIGRKGGLAGLSNGLDLNLFTASALADSANLLDELERAVQIRVSDRIPRKNREFCYFAAFSFAEVSLGAWL